MKSRWIFWGLAIVFVWVVVSRFTEIKALAQTLSQGKLQWVLAAAVLQVCYYILYTGIYQAAFHTVEVESRLGELIPVTFSAIFVNVVAPAGGASGAALFVDDAARRGQSPARAAVGVLLMLVADFSAFSLVLLFGLIYLFLNHALKSYEVVTALILLLIILGMSFLVTMGLWQPERLRRLLAWVQRRVNGLGARFRRPNLVSESWAERTANEFIEAALAISVHPDRLARTLATAIFAQICDLSSLYMVSLAFYGPVSVGVLVAAYAMGILFWIVAITPQGIGVVEGLIALTFSSLGMPAAKATVIALSFRGLTFWLPFAIGFVLLRRARIFGVQERTRTEALSVRAVAILTGLTGIMNVIAAVTPVLRGRLALIAAISPLEVRRGGRLTEALAGFALLLLASNLWRRKRVAWLVTLFVLIISVISHLLKGLDVENAILPAALAVWLFYLRPHFHARSDPPSIQQGLVTLAAALVFTVAYGATGFYLLDHQFRVTYDLGAALRQTLIMFSQFYDPGLQPITGLGRYFAGSIYVVGAVTLSYAFLMLVRPVLVRHPAIPADWARARQIIETWGQTSLARLCLLPDKSYFFSPGGSVVAFVVKGRFALALGDPIGPPEDISSAITGFKEFCISNDWAPVFYQTQPDTLGHYGAAGLDALCIGHEGIVDWENFSLEGRANKGLRSGYNRITRLGYRAEVCDPPLSKDLLSQLHIISDEWLTLVHGTEMRFSLGWFDEGYIANSRVMLIYDPQGNIDAFATILPEYRKNEAGIDLMRHRSEIENGVMDFLFVSLFQWSQQQGYATFNLGLSALSGIGERPQDPAIERALHYIYEHVDQFYNFKGVHEFKAKFHPTWSPRYLVYPGLGSLPAATIALVRADSGDDMVVSYLLH
ncbi:MAG TPA: flippase-like domain-containing protein [Anaerolineales bacterium]